MYGDVVIVIVIVVALAIIVVFVDYQRTVVTVENLIPEEDARTGDGAV